MPTLSGTVKDANGNLARRLVRAHRRSDGAIASEALSDPVTGVFSLSSLDYSKHYVIAHDSDCWLTHLPMNAYAGYDQSVVDLNWSDVAIRMPFDGSNGATTFTELKGNAVTRFGNAQISTAQSKFGGASLFLDGTGDYLTIPSNTSFNMSSGDFTIEFWIRPTGASYSTVMQKTESATSESSFRISFLPGMPNAMSATLYFSDGTFVALDTPKNTVSANNWYHFALVRSGSTATLYIDGVAKASASVGSKTLGWKTLSPSPLYIGTEGGSSDFAGYIEDLRITKGVARTIVVPTAAYPATGPLNIFYEYGGKAVSVYGGARIDTSQSKFGGASAYFDGLGDYLTLPVSGDLAFGSGDFTIEAWVRLNNIGAERAIFDSRASSSDTGLYFYITSANQLAAFGNNAAILTGTTALQATTWHHVALSKSAGVMRLFLDGAQVASATSGYSITCPSAPMIGRKLGSLTNDFAGFMDDFRICKGVARYTSNFSVPTAAHSVDEKNAVIFDQLTPV